MQTAQKKSVTLRKSWKQSVKNLFLGGLSAGSQLKQNGPRCNSAVDDCSTRKQRPMEYRTLNFKTSESEFGTFLISKRFSELYFRVLSVKTWINIYKQ